jgi:ABC-type antimicrobial peptide transport system permease subunit
MLRNYFKMAFRNLWKHRLFSAINIIGLSIGLSASFVIGLMIYYDFTFDKFHQDSDRIYRITTDFISPEHNFYNRGVPVPLSDVIRESESGIELVSTFTTTYIDKVSNENTDIIVRDIEDVIYTDEQYFKLFSYQWLAGNPKGVLSEPNEIVLTKKRAAKYFPNLSPHKILGKILIYNDSVPVKVVGIIANFKERSDFIFQEFISFKTAHNLHEEDLVFNKEWNNTNSATQVFVKLIENQNVTDFQQRLDKLAKEHEDKETVSYGEIRKFHLQPLRDIHFNANYGVFDNSSGQASKSILVSLAFVALFLLLLACINFINLNTANATKRSKEIGIRKTLGSSKKQLILQFLGEAFLLTITAAIVSLFFSVGLLNIFADFMPKGIHLSLLANPVLIFSMVVLLLIVALLSGFYPAMVLSKYKPISVLKSQFFSENNSFSLRKYLMVFQFVIAQVFIIATLLVGKQIYFLMHKDMGFKTNAIAYIRTPWQDNSFAKRIQFAKEIKKLPQITAISLGGNPPASFSTHSTSVNFFNKDKEIRTSLQLLSGDQNYLDVYQIKLLAGRKPLNDTIKEYVINKTYANILGFKTPQEAIGRMLEVNDQQIPIVGVMNDFNQRSLKSKIEPLAIMGDWNRQKFSRFNTIHLALQTQNTATTISQIEKIWKTIYPDSVIKVNFMDETVKKFYRQEQKMIVLLNWATFLAILISVLGLLGLVIFNTERRVKEIGIRKVLGATIIQINVLLSKEFLTLVSIAFVIAAPIAWWALNRWLQGFAYKTTLSWWVFVLSGLAMLGIALIIISIKTVSSANANPVKSLRTE